MNSSTPLSRKQKETLIYRHTHRDYRGSTGDKAILVMRAAGTTLVPLTELTEAEVEDLLPYALRKEAARLQKATA